MRYAPTDRMRISRFVRRNAFALLSLVVTPVFAALAVRWQLSEEHDYWQAQQRVLRDEKLHEEKIRHLTAVTETLAEIRSLTYSIDTSLFFESVDVHLNLLYPERARADSTSEFEFIRNAYRERERQVSRIQSSLVTTRVLFAPPVDSAVNRMIEKLAQGFPASISSADMLTALIQAKTENRNTKIVVDSLLAAHLEQTADPEFVQTVNLLIERMSAEVGSDL